MAKATEVVAVKDTTAKNKAAAATREALAVLSTGIREDHEQWVMAKRDAAYRGVRLGLRFWKAKELCAHGTFLEWLSTNHPEITARSAQLFMQDASLILEQKQLAGMGPLLLGEGKAAEVRKADKALLDFIADRTQRELREELKGGAQKPLKKSTPKEQYDLKRECLVNLRVAGEQIVIARPDLDKEQYDTACARALKTLEDLTGCVWSPDPEEKRDRPKFQEHAHVYQGQI